MYTAGILKERVTILIPGTTTEDEWGRTKTEGSTITRWAAVDYSRGTRSMREGALEAYDTIMVRMMYNSQITKDCKLQWQGNTYHIQSLHADKQANTIQITAAEETQS